jgi:hypothetical protein
MTGDIVGTVVTGVRDPGGSEESVQPESRRAVAARRRITSIVPFMQKDWKGFCIIGFFQST